MTASPSKCLLFPALVFPAVMLLLATLPGAAQDPTLRQRTAADNDAITTIRARAKLVVIDVVVTGKDRVPFQGLKQSDFTLTEGGQPQTIKSFEEHRALSAADALKFPPLPALPPGIFTNYVPAPENAAVNVLLLDALNTPLKDQVFVRDQLLDYAKKAKPGTSVAIFGLTTQLHMLQGFTSNPETLRKAIQMAQGKFSPLLDDPVGGGTTESLADQMAAFGPSAATAAAGVSNLESMEQSFQMDMRAKYTLDAMSSLARYLANIPGRKNLIWFSGSFPIDIMPDETAADPFLSVASNEEEYRQTTNMLARAQVAVYPIDARGLMTLPMFNASNGGAKYARNPNAMGTDSTKFFNQTSGEHSTMNRMAFDTGGEAFVNTNGLAIAVGKAIDAGSNYYSIAYTPTNNVWKGDYRKVDIKFDKPGYVLAYRRGYYADDPDSPSSALAASSNVTATARANAQPAPNAMLQAMIHGLPGGTQIIYKVRVLPSTAAPEDTLAPRNVAGEKGFIPVKAPYRRFQIDYAADPHDITFTPNPDGTFHASLEFVALVYQPDGQLAVARTDSLDVTLPADRYAALMHGGLPMRQEISVPTKGDYTIRTGIHDVLGNRIGAIEIPVTSVIKLAPIK